MKLLPPLILILVLLFTATSFNSNERIPWSKYRKIQWSDFEGTPDHSDQIRDAVTASALRFTTRCNADGMIELFVDAEFVKHQSWVKPVARNDYHLAHERLHFDITELFARLFRERIEDSHFACEDKEAVDLIIQQHLAACHEIQDLYDKQTRNSMDSVRQQEWQSKIESELKRLERFASH